MHCEWTQERLPELLGGTLPREAEQPVLEHLASCADCRAELAFWAQVAGAVRERAKPAEQTLLDDVATSLFEGEPMSPWQGLRLAGQSLQLTWTLYRSALRSASGAM